MKKCLLCNDDTKMDLIGEHTTTDAEEIKRILYFKCSCGYTEEEVEKIDNRR